MNEALEKKREIKKDEYFKECSSEKNRRKKEYVFNAAWNACHAELEAHPEYLDKVKGLIEALEFYADPDNWGWPKGAESFGRVINKNDVEATMTMQWRFIDCGGTRARLALRNVNNEKD